MSLSEDRRSIRHLLNERDPADGMAAYYAFHHPDEKTRLVTFPPKAARATGYVCLSRTGADLFRPLVTLRLPPDMDQAAELLDLAVSPGLAVIITGPVEYQPLLAALFAIDQESRLRICTLDRNRFEPIINVLVVRETGPNGMPRFTIRSGGGAADTLASAGVNWQLPHLAEINVNTQVSNRRQGLGRSVVAALCQYLLESGRAPIYVVAEDNVPSLQLAESVGFVDTGRREVIIYGTRRPAA